MRGNLFSLLCGASLVVGCGDNSDTVELDDFQLTTAEDTLVRRALDVPSGTAITVSGAPAHGAVTLSGNTLTYTPAGNYFGPDSLTLSIGSGSGATTTTASITVTPVNDAPVGTADSLAADEDTDLNVTKAQLLQNDEDVDEDDLTLTAVGSETNGTAEIVGDSVRFRGNPNFAGAASFSYTVFDGTASVMVTVQVAVGGENDVPTANDDDQATNEDTAKEILATALVGNDTDVELQTLTVEAVGTASNGTVALDATKTKITYTPNQDFNGTDSFEYTVTDGADDDIGRVTVTVAPVNDAPVAVNDTSAVQAGNSIEISIEELLSDDTDVDNDNDELSIVDVVDEVDGVATLNATTITFTPNAGFEGTASFKYVVSDGDLTALGTVLVTVTVAAVCGDGTVAEGEACDDGNLAVGDGCNAACAVEDGFDCEGSPSACIAICGDGLQVGNEQCDDNNLVDEDGCTSLCRDGVVCTAAAIPGGDRFDTDPATGSCYVSFDDDQTTFAAAEAACVALDGYLATITSAAESARVLGVHNTAQNPWIGASEDGTDDDAVFDWVTDEAFGFANFATGQPDDDLNDGGNGECLHLVNAAGQWNDTNCGIATFVVGRICELEVNPCGDSVLQDGEECDSTAASCSATCQLAEGCGDGNIDAGEECDDDNLDPSDACSATCQITDGCGDGNLDAGEECDDDNLDPSDNCSATCQVAEGCGDGNVDPGEECDDDNLDPSDACSATCQLTNGCGDGNIDTGEDCDDDGLSAGDGCSATCTFELVAGISCIGALGNEVTIPADVTAAGLAQVPALVRGTGIQPNAGGSSFNSNNWTQTAALDPTDFVGFTVTPAPGVTVNMLQLQFGERRSGTGPQTWELRSSLDNFQTAVASGATTPSATFTTQSVVLPAQFRNLTTAVELRVFGASATATAGTWRVGLVKLVGFTTLP